MDEITQSMLTTLRIEEMLHERQPRHESGAPWYGGAGSASMRQPDWLHRHLGLRLPLGLRRRIAALLIHAGRRLGDGAPPRGCPLYGSAHH